MRRNRILFFSLWAASLVLISFYGGQISYGIFMLLTLLFAASLVYIFAVYFLLKIYQKHEGRDLTAGRPSPFYFTLQNESFLGFAGVRVLFYSEFSSISGLRDETEYELSAHSGIRRETTIVCKYRGYYDIGIRKIVVQDFLRLFTVTFQNREPFRVTVRPNRILPGELRHAEMVLSAARDLRGEQSIPDVLVREYVPGDDPRLMSWKMSAARGTLLLRERVGERQQGVGILLDSCRRFSKMEQYLPAENKVLEIVLALNLFFQEKNIPVATYYEARGLRRSLVEQRSGFEELYERMSALSFESDHTLKALWTEAAADGGILAQRAVFLVTQEWNDETERIAAELRKAQVQVIAYVVQEQGENGAALSDAGEIRVFVSPEDDIREVL